MSEIAPDVDCWARALGFLDVTDDVYRGAVGDHAALLAEFSVGSPSVSEGFGGAGANFSIFTLLLIGVDAHLWPRLTVHPAAFSDHAWMRRIFHKDHKIHTVSPEMDSRYRVIASDAI